MIFKANGKLGMNGLFGVTKPKDVPGQPGVSQLRLICNLVPTNSYFRDIKGRQEGDLLDITRGINFGSWWISERSVCGSRIDKYSKEALDISIEYDDTGRFHENAI